MAMFDEVAAEKQIRWDPKTNYFLGVCREHAEKILMEFINEKDMEEVFRCLDEGEIYYAGEVRTMTAWVIFTSVPRADLAIFRLPSVLLAFCAMIIAYTQHVQCLHLAIVKRNLVKNIQNSFRLSLMEFQNQNMVIHSMSFPSHLMVKPGEVQHFTC